MALRLQGSKDDLSNHLDNRVLSYATHKDISSACYAQKYKIYAQQRTMDFLFQYRWYKARKMTVPDCISVSCLVLDKAMVKIELEAH